MGRILAIDYGLKRTGIAWTDPLQIIATAVGTYETTTLWKELKEIFKTERIDTIVLGYPTRMDGSDTHATQPVRDFKKRLDKQYPKLPVILWDERLTSKMAQRALIDGGVPQKKRRKKGLLDQVAATLMLQEYLESVS